MESGPEKIGIKSRKKSETDFSTEILHRRLVGSRDRFRIKAPEIIGGGFKFGNFQANLVDTGES